MTGLKEEEDLLQMRRRPADAVKAPRRKVSEKMENGRTALIDFPSGCAD